MTWRTHIAVGLNALWLAPFFGPLDRSFLVLLPVVVIASLLPDIDASSAKIHYALGGVLRVFKGSFHGKYFHHRGIMHSLFVAVLIFIILVIIFKNTIPALPYVAAVSYFSHALIDGLNTGVGFFYPFVKRFSLVPKVMRTPVGGIIDKVLFFVGLMFILLFFAAFKNQFVPANLNF